MERAADGKGKGKYKGKAGGDGKGRGLGGGGPGRGALPAPGADAAHDEVDEAELAGGALDGSGDSDAGGSLAGSGPEGSDDEWRVDHFDAVDDWVVRRDWEEAREEMEVVADPIERKIINAEKFEFTRRDTGRSVVVALSLFRRL